MTKIKFFQELINSLFEKPKINKSLNFLFDKKKSLTTKEYVENVASAKGEVSALGHAELLITHCEQLNDRELIKFFELLRKNYEVNLDDLLSRENNTRGGDKDKEEKEFIVFPNKTELYLVATTVIPVAKAESVFLKLSLFTFFIIFFVKKLRLSVYYF